MNLRKLIFTENACYKAGRKIDVKGIMVHSTGANNPWLKRYVGPDDGVVGQNPYNNHWNKYYPDARDVCPHAFIGRLADGSIATYQVLPWNHRGWHCGGKANDTHISFEICEDDLTDSSYFEAVYKEAVELCVYLCREYGLTEHSIICHSEGAGMGIASNHADVMHWFPRFGKSMDTFRADVKAQLDGVDTKPEPGNKPEVKPEPSGIKAGDLVSIAGERYYTGEEIPRWVRRRKWYVQEVKGDRVVISEDESRMYRIISPVNVADLRVIATEPAKTQRVHTVVHGDTLWDIAERYLGDGRRYPEIKRLNNLSSNVIYTGWKLKIPD